MLNSVTQVSAHASHHDRGALGLASSDFHCCLRLLFGISLIWMFLALFLLLCSFAWKIQDSCILPLGMGVVGLRAASLCTNWQEPALVGSSNHNPFAAILSHAWQAWSISSDQRFRKTGPEKEPSGEQNIEPWNGMSGNRLTFTGSCSTGILARVDSCSFMHVFFLTLQKTGWPKDAGKTRAAEPFHLQWRKGISHILARRVPVPWRLQKC